MIKFNETNFKASFELIIVIGLLLNYNLTYMCILYLNMLMCLRQTELHYGTLTEYIWMSQVFSVRQQVCVLTVYISCVAVQVSVCLDEQLLQLCWKQLFMHVFF